MSGAVAIFVKTPGRSALKTRLVTVCGRAWAEDWYRRAALAVASVAQRACASTGMVAYWAVAESGAESEWSGLPTIGQGEGSLGARMARVHAALVARHGFALLIGADTPQLDADSLVTAAHWLQRAQTTAQTIPTSAARFALGPAADGGFWLFGSNRPVAAETWSSVRYSQPHAARDLQHALHGLGKWRVFNQLADVDHAEDLDVALRALDALTNPTRAQLALSRWMHAAESVL